MAILPILHGYQIGGYYSVDWNTGLAYFWFYTFLVDIYLSWAGSAHKKPF